MKGKVTMRVSPNGVAVETELSEVNIVGKFEMMHALSVALQMDRLDLKMFCDMECARVFADAEQVTECETTEELDTMLQGVQHEG